MHRALPAGETTTTVSPFVPGGVSDGQWHRVQLHYYNKVGVWGGGGHWDAAAWGGGRRDGDVGLMGGNGLGWEGRDGGEQEGDGGHRGDLGG